MLDIVVTIIIPALNEEEFIGRCIDALMNLDYPKDMLRIIVIDNFSDDRTKEIATKFGVAVMQVKPISIAHSRNVGAANAMGEILAFIDADCLAAPNWLKQAIGHFGNDNVVAAGSYPLSPEKESNRLQKTWSALCRGNDAKVRKTDWLPSANLLVRKSAFDKIGGFDESLITCEDADLGFRLSNVGILINDPAISVTHLREPKTWSAFFKKEVWHSHGNLSGIFIHGYRMSELPSLILPLIFGFGLLGFPLAFVSVKIIPLLGLCIGVPILLYTFKGYRTVKDFNYLICIYLVYLSARAYSAYIDIFATILKLFKLRDEKQQEHT